MKNFRTRKWLKGLILVALLFTGCMFLSNSTTDVQAATAGFKTIGGKTYYIKSDGSKQKGWLTLGKYKYYFNKTTGVQVKGWLSVSGKKTYYFTSKKGAMVTGWMTDSKKHKRYFNPKTGKLTRGWMKNSKGQKWYFRPSDGVMYRGLKKIGSYYFTSGEGVMATGWMKNSKGQKRYFYSNSGVMATGWLKNTSKNITYYFDTDTGYMYTGLNRISGKLYYFKSNGVMAVSTTVSVNGVTYSISATGVATAKTSKPNVNVSNGNVKVYDTTNSRYYTMVKEYKSHPGIANGKTTDEALLAALCEAEAGNQGKIGMEAVALCVLNRTIKSDKEFPSTIRGVIYENIGSSTTPQYSVVRDGALAKRLKGTFENRTLAYQAAREAMTIFNNYVKTGKARTLSGFKKKDFNYMYFMMNSAFKKQPLTFSKVEYEVYKDHTFFVDWV